MPIELEEAVAAMSSQTSLPGAHGLQLAAAKLARCRALHAELARLVQSPLDTAALGRVTELQRQAVAAAADLDAEVAAADQFDAMWTPIGQEDSGTAHGDVGAAPSGSDGPYRSSRETGT